MCISVFLYSNTDTLYNISHAPGFYDKEIDVFINSLHGDLFYNTKGKIATTRSKRINGKIRLNKTTNINIALYNGNKLIHRESLTYFFNFKTDFPIVSVYINPDDLWSSRKGIYVKGNNAVFDSTRGYWINANYWKKWEKNVFFEFFESDKKRVISQECGFRLAGGMTRQLKDKSLRLVARKEYGESRFKHNFFPVLNSKKYKNIVLRNSGGDYSKSRFKDVFVTQLAKEIDLPAQEFRPAILFVNGEYWGVYNIREKIDERFLERNYDVNKDSLDLIQGRMVVEHGDDIEYKQMLNFVKKNNLSVKKNYDSLSTMMDINNYIDYIVTQLYIANKDCRGNIRFWKYPKDKGKFKWILYDTDLSFGGGLEPSFNFFQKLISPIETDWYNPTWSTFLLRNLLKNEDFKSIFFNRMCFLLATTYSTENVISKIDYYADIYEPEMPRHFDSKPGSFRYWYKYVEKMKSFALERPSYLIKHVSEEFNYINFYELFIENNFSHSGIIKVNGVELDSDVFKGVFYKENSLFVEAQNKFKYEFKGWRNFSDSSELVLNYSNVSGDKLILQPVFERNIESKFSDTVLINEIAFLKFKDRDLYWLEIFNSSDSKVELEKITLINNKNVFEIKNFNIDSSGYNVICNDTSLFKDFFGFNDNIFQIDFDFIKSNTIQLIDDNNRLLDTLSFEVKDTFALDLLNPLYDNNNLDNWSFNSEMTPGYINYDYSDFLEEEKRILLANKLFLKKKKRKKRLFYGATISSVAGSIIYFIVH